MSRLICFALALPLLAVSCNGTETTDETDIACDIRYQMFPEEGSSRAYYRTTVDATFSEVVEGATLTLKDASGADVAGATVWDGKRLVFTPTDALTPSSQYTATVAFECVGEPAGGSVSWTVSEVGAPTDLTTLVGRDYALDLGSARFLRPDAIGGLIGDFLDFDILVAVKEANDTSITMFGALGETGQPGQQAQCTETIDFPAAGFTGNPYFELGPQTLEVSVSDVDVQIQDMFLSGSFSPDGSYIDGVTLAGIIDTRPLASIVDNNPDAPPETVCEFTGRLGINCIACPDGSGEYCLELLADSISADSAGVSDLTEIDDPCALPQCADDPDCTGGGGEG